MSPVFHRRQLVQVGSWWKRRLRLKVINLEIHQAIDLKRRQQRKRTCILQHGYINDIFALFLSSPTLLYFSLWHHFAAVANATYNHCSISSLVLSVREDWRGPVDTHTSHSQLHKCGHTSTSTRTQKPVESSMQERMCRPTRPAVDSQWTWGLGLASVKRGTISCPSASKKSTQGTRANIFSTQIGYSNYPRLFNLATRLEALFQVPTTNTARIGGSGLDGRPSPRYIPVATMSNRGQTVGVCYRDSTYEFKLSHYRVITGQSVIKWSSSGVQTQQSRTVAPLQQQWSSCMDMMLLTIFRAVCHWRLLCDCEWVSILNPPQRNRLL